MRTLIAIDVQDDFTENGRLAVAGGDAVAHGIGAHVAAHRDQYAYVVTTQDWHIDPGEHFAAPGTDPDYNVSWPVHCAAGKDGSGLDPELDRGAGRPFTDLVDAAFRKGQYAAAYSGFEGTDDTGVLLGDWLAARGVTDVDVAGIATDYCVAATVRDALAAGLRVRLLADLTAGVAPETTQAALAELAAAGAQVLTSDQAARVDVA